MKHLIRLDPAALEASVPEIARFAGGPRFQPDDDISALVQMAAAKVRAVIKPSYCFSLWPAQSEQDFLQEVARSVFWCGENPVALEAVCQVAYVVCSVGKMERLHERQNQQSLSLEGLLSNAAGLVFLEAVAKRAWQDVASRVSRQGFFAGARLEPGCNSISLELQQHVCARASAEKIGVKLSPACVMTPFMSLAFAVPLSCEPVEPFQHKCQGCSLKSCLYREEGK